EEKWHLLAAKKTGIQLINRGASGDTTEDMLNRIQQQVFKAKPDGVILMGGYNDIFFNHRWEQAAQNMITMVDQSRAKGLQVYIAIPPPIRLPVAFKEGGAVIDFERSAEMVEVYCQWLRDYTTSSRIPILDFRAGTDWNDPDLYLDGIHQSPAGHQLMANCVIAFLEKLPRPISQPAQQQLILVKPSEKHQQQAEAFKQEFFDHGETIINGSALLDQMNYRDWLENTQRNGDPQTVRPDWVVAETFLAIREADNQIVGIIDFRHSLNEFLGDYGGHIGYAVRPGERKKGYATAMLRQSLSYAKEMGLEAVMLGCYSDNGASRNIIEKCGGILTCEKLYLDGNPMVIYWIKTKTDLME
ncbi:MAG: hypothetical protein CVV01_03490, partial [Firmicutes bacterium HGW-Firmicutes-6]